MSQVTRKIEDDNDWSFGQGRTNYVSDLLGVAQCIRTRLQSILGDCFFDLGAGMDWYNLLGSKDDLSLKLALRACILNTKYVTGLQELDVTINSAREFRISYVATCVFPGVLRSNLGVLATEDGFILITEDGDQINA